MAASSKSEARLNFRLNAELKAVIEEAATALGQPVNDYAVATLVGNARHVLQATHATRLSRRDSQRLMSMLDDVEARPTKALTEAARRYKRSIG